MEEEFHERPPPIRHVAVHDMDNLNGSTRSQTPLPITHSNNQDLMRLTNTEKLTRENFPVWKFHICILLHARKLLGMMDGPIPREPFTDEEDKLSSSLP